MPDHPTCGTCRFVKPDIMSDGPDREIPILECHRHAPRPGIEHGDLHNWPIVSEDDFCGEWQQAEQGVLPRAAGIPVAALNLSCRGAKAVDRCGVKTVEEVAELSEVDLLSQKNCGWATVNEIHRQMGRLGYEYDPKAGSYRLAEHRREGAE